MYDPKCNALTRHFNSSLARNRDSVHRVDPDAGLFAPVDQKKIGFANFGHSICSQASESLGTERSEQQVP